MNSAVFYRNLRGDYTKIVRGEGVYLFDSEGQRFLDAVGGVAVVCIGHGVREIFDAVARQGSEIAYAYNGLGMTTRWQEELAQTLVGVAPKGMSSVYFVSGGSEANETAIKMARQYHLYRGIPTKHKIIARGQSFHGVTLATLALSGRPSWREPYDPYLIHVPRINPPYCYRCPLGRCYPSCELACADELERAILSEGPDSVAAFIAEPVIGTSATAIVPKPEYYARIQEICNRYDILFIADEILCGYGRTGDSFAINHWDISPDILTAGKGIGSGYAPIAAVIASEKVVSVFRESQSGEFTHGFTQSGNAMACFVGLQVYEYIDKHNLFEQSAIQGKYLHEQLAQLAEHHPMIGEVRGRGLLAGIEFVKNRETRQPFPCDEDVTTKIVCAARDRGVLLIPGLKDWAHGQGADHIQISPPYVISKSEIDEIVHVLDDVIGWVDGQVNTHRR